MEDLYETAFYTAYTAYEYNDTFISIEHYLSDYNRILIPKYDKRDG